VSKLWVFDNLINLPQRLFFRSELQDHAVYFAHHITRCPCSEMFKDVDILSSQGLFCSSTNHPTLYPHLSSLCNGQSGALGNKYRRELSISSSQNFIVERLADLELEQLERWSKKHGDLGGK